MSNTKIKKVTALFDYIRRHNDEVSYSLYDLLKQFLLFKFCNI